MKRKPSERAAKPASDRMRRHEGARCLIVEARFYQNIADELLKGALRVLENAGARGEVVTVPGALEIPVALVIALEAAAARGAPYDAAIALGCVIRGETGHYDIVAGESARALMDIAVERRLPLGNGILTVETEEQALERAEIARLDKGGGAAEAALAVLALKRAAPVGPLP
jgi:6,7-dimethyl-8-ribityllumazine synthase